MKNNNAFSPSPFRAMDSQNESLIEILNWLVGWSRMVPPRFDKQT